MVETVSVLAASAVATVLGSLVVEALWPSRGGSDGFGTFRLGLGLGLGHGLAALYWLLVAIAFGAAPRTGWIADGVLVAVMAVWAALRHRRAATQASGWLAPGPGRACGWLLAGVAAVALLQAVSVVDAFPYGDADGLQTWQYRARVLVRAFGDWEALFQTHEINPDYPLLVPAMVARGAHLAGSGHHAFVGIWPQAVFVVATCLTLGGAIRRLGAASEACLAVAALLATPLYVRLAAMQFATPVHAFWILQGVVLLTLARRRDDGGPSLALLGLVLGLAACTKREGLVWVACVVAVVLLWRTDRWRSLLAIGAGAGPPLILPVWMAVAHPAPNWYLRHRPFAAFLEHWDDPERYAALLGFVGDRLLFLADWGAPWGIGPVFVLAYGWWVGAAARRPPTRDASLALGLLAVAYLGVEFCLDPGTYPLSVSRLICQLFPAFLFLVFVRLRGVGTEVGGRADPSTV